MKTPNNHEVRELSFAEQQSIKGGSLSLLAILKIIEILVPLVIMVLTSMD